MVAQLAFEAVHARLAPDDPRWQRQLQALTQGLEDRVGPVGRMRGQLRLALGSAGAIAAAVMIFRAWLGRDKRRSLRLRRADGEAVAVGENISEDLLRRALEVAATEGS